MKILHVASEVTPYAKSGGLADVVGSLPAALRRLGHDVRVAVPLYRSAEEAGGIRMEGVAVTVPLGGGMHRATLGTASREGVTLWFVGNREFFGRDALYGEGEEGYPDNHLRFAFFCRAVLEFCRRLDFRPDIIHCHDWQAALIPLLLRYEPGDDLFFERSATLFTIHNLAYQGLCSRTSLGEMGLDSSLFTVDGLEFYGAVNLMKGGLQFADLISTVSPTYCREILTPEQGFGLDGLLRWRERDLSGILNGIDTERWNPAADPHLPRRYAAGALGGKKGVRKELRKELGLTPGEAPLLGMVSRIVSQKGFDLIVELLPRFESAGLDLVILGNGEERYLRELAAAGERSGRLRLCTGSFNEPLAHRIYAGSDLFLMPSRYEPCGISQLIALRYGAVPVVRKSGGLADTVRDAGQKGGTGFVFGEYTAGALWEAIERALALYGKPGEWRRLVRRGMRSDLSWDASAVRYEELYRTALARRRSGR